MKQSHKVFLAIACFLCIETMLTTSCEKLHEQIGYIKNNTSHDIIGAEMDQKITDSTLYLDKVYFSYYIQPGLTEALTTRPNSNFNSLQNSASQTICFFDADTIDKYRKLKVYNGLFKHSLIKKVKIQLNQVKAFKDTIFLTSNN